MAIPQENQGRLPQTFATALNQALVLFINFVGFFGIFLILYSGLIYFYGPWQPVEAIADTVTVITTTLGVILISLSIYMPENNRKPDAFSKFILAPAVIVFCLGVLVAHVAFSFDLPKHLINGISILGLCGALFRTVSRNIAQ